MKSPLPLRVFIFWQMALNSLVQFAVIAAVVIAFLYPRMTDQALSSLWWALGLGLLVSFAIGALLSAYRSHKLTQLTGVYIRNAQAMAQGHYEVTWPVSKTREYQDLSRHLTDMSRTIQTREKTLAESEKNLRIILDSIGDGVIATDTEGLITRINPAAAALTGCPAEAALGRPLADVLHVVSAETGERVRNPVEKVLASGAVVALSNHTLLRSKDGQTFHIADCGAPIRDDAGRMVGVVLVIRDISEVHGQHQELRRREALLHSVTANVPGVIYQIKADNKGRYWVGFISDKVDQVFGYGGPPEQFLATFREHVPEKESAEMMASFEAAVAAERKWSWEGRYMTSSGEIVWFSNHTSMYREGDDLIITSLLMDISDRKRGEQALTQSEQRYRELFDKAPVMYLITENRKGQAFIRDANRLFLEALGYARDAVLGKPLADFYTPASREALMDRGGYRKALAGHTLDEERDLVDAAGRVVHTLLHTLPETDARGEVVGTRATFLDITDRKRAEAQTRRLQEALRQAQKMEALGTLAGGIAHDFNNILSGVIGYAELGCMQTEKGTRLHDNLSQILRAGKRAGDLVRQILTFSRQEERQLKPLLMAPLVKEALKLLRSSLPSTIEIAQEIGTGLDNVMADPTQVHQIVMNLCTNAAQAMPAGGRIRITLTQVQLDKADLPPASGLKPGDYLQLTVQDSGQGIAPEDLENIFDPYFTTKEKGKGTGLGLAVVHGIVQSYGGHVAVESRPGEGSLFSVCLPAVKQASGEAHKRAAALPGGHERILLVDDEPDLLAVGQQMLELLGYRVTVCQKSTAALGCLREAPRDYDLVISDMTMPKMAGDRLAAEILKIRADLPIILSTGFARPLSAEDVRSFGAQALLKKPFVSDELARLVRRVLDSA